MVLMRRLTCIIFFLLLLALLLAPKWYLKNESVMLTAEEKQYIHTLGDSALQTLDVPVVAILKYEEQIIGKGYNTVKRNGRVGEHAEINALSYAINAMGIDSFNLLNRDKLVLLTTLEPCKMCEGAIVEAYIKNVEIIQVKGLSQLLGSEKMRLIYQWNKKAAQSDSLQLQLLLKHPAYKKQ
jgi:tRNA(Arg) A34 adenosine deaminase TadA